ncbi:MAG: DUF4167 domain-containing protein, partial [Sphingomonadales bacterium]|nr:DUF4167 domain-containing protein [Sphingomonadales bacterium]
AQVNGDRVQAEYYHQFADHYFRVNADTIARREEQRIAREEPRGDNSPDNRGDNRGNGPSQDDSSDDDGDNYRSRPQPPQQNRPQRDDRNDRNDRDDMAANDAPEEKKPVRSRRPRQIETAEKNGESNGLDASALPPAILQSTEVEVEKKSVRKKRVIKPRAIKENDAV